MANNEAGVYESVAGSKGHKGKTTVSSIVAKILKNSTLKLVFFACGIMVSFVMYGVVQERIMTIPYKTDLIEELPEDDHDEDYQGEMFKQSAFLVLMNRIVASFLAFTVILLTYLWSGDKSKGVVRNLKGVAPFYAYCGVSFSNITATWCQYEALKYVNFPTQTLGKTGKMIPVMIIGTLVHGKKYSLKDYIVNGLITLGCTIFVLSGDVSSHAGKENTSMGILLMFVYLTVDGFTSTLQEKLFKGYTMSTWNQMLHVNLCSAIVSTVILIVTGGMYRAFAFIAKYPVLLRDSLALSFCSAFGQVCIYSVIKEFGAIVFAGIMVTRQVVSVVVSCLIFLHPLTSGQVVSAVLVFAVLFYKDLTKKRAPKKPASPELPVTKRDVVAADLPDIHSFAQNAQFGAKVPTIPILPPHPPKDGVISIN